MASAHCTTSVQIFRHQCKLLRRDLSSGTRCEYQHQCSQPDRCQRRLPVLERLFTEQCNWPAARSCVDSWRRIRCWEWEARPVDSDQCQWKYFRWRGDSIPGVFFPLDVMRRQLISRKLAAFGFLSSDEVFRNGVVNAGILDQVRRWP